MRAKVMKAWLWLFCCKMDTLQHEKQISERHGICTHISKEK